MTFSNDLLTDCQGCIQTGRFEESFADSAVSFAQRHADQTGHVVIVEQKGLSMVVRRTGVQSEADNGL